MLDTELSKSYSSRYMRRGLDLIISKGPREEIIKVTHTKKISQNWNFSYELIKLRKGGPLIPHRVVQRFLIGAPCVNLIRFRDPAKKSLATITLLKAFRCILVELKTFAIPENGSSLNSRGKRGFSDHLAPSNKRPRRFWNMLSLHKLYDFSFV